MKPHPTVSTLLHTISIFSQPISRTFLLSISFFVLIGSPATLQAMLPPGQSLSVVITYEDPEPAPEPQAEQSPAPKPRKTCAICLEQLYNKAKAEFVIQSPCSRKHAFHYLCMARVHSHISVDATATCPLCRAQAPMRVTSPESVDLIVEQLQQEKMDRMHLEGVAFFKEQRIQELLRKNENLAHQNSSLLEEVTRLQWGDTQEYNVAQHPARSGKRKNKSESKRNKRRKRYWHAHNNQQNRQDNPAPEA
jgi:hypothetical protein